MTPSWYDLLDVAPDASAAEVRAAWRSAVADLDPTDRRFGVYNRAAEVLLDPERRAAYDAERAAAAAADEEGAGATTDGGTPAATAGTAAAGTGATSVAPSGVTAGRWLVPAWLLAGLAVATALLVGACVWVVTTQPSDATVQEAGRAAQSAAETAMGPVLSYDYRHLEEDQKAAESYMTPSYRKQYDKLFEVVKQNAPNTRTVLGAKVLDSGIVRAGADRVEVLLFVDQPTTNKSTATPIVYKDQVRAQMQKVGGDWLVDCLITSPNGSCD